MSPWLLRLHPHTPKPRWAPNMSERVMSPRRCLIKLSSVASRETVIGQPARGLPHDGQQLHQTLLAWKMADIAKTCTGFKPEIGMSPSLISHFVRLLFFLCEEVFVLSDCCFCDALEIMWPFANVKETKSNYLVKYNFQYIATRKKNHPAGKSTFCLFPFQSLLFPLQIKALWKIFRHFCWIQ